MDDNDKSQTAPLVERFPIPKTTLNRLFSLDLQQSIENLTKSGGIPQLIDSLLTDSQRGISSDSTQKQARKLAYGENISQNRAEGGSILLQALKDKTVFIFISVSAASLIYARVQNSQQLYQESLAALAAIILLSLLQIVSYSIQRYLFCSNIRKSSIFNVIREGRRLHKSAQQLLVGELIRLSTGERVPADSLILASSDFKVDEYTLTKNPGLISKDSIASPLLFSGSVVAEGSATAIVLAVGDSTLSARNGPRHAHTDTYLQKRIHRLSLSSSLYGFILAVLTFIILAIHTLDCQNWTQLQWRQLFRIFMLGLALIMLAIPEGLSSVVNLSVAYTIARSRDSILDMKKLCSVETMGRINNIILHKSSLTAKHHLKLGHLYAQERELQSFGKEEFDPSLLQLLTKIIVYCTEENNESILHDLLSIWGQDAHTTRSNHTVIDSTVAPSKTVSIVQDGQQRLVLVRGEGFATLDLCSFYVNSNGAVQEIDEYDQFQKILQDLEDGQSSSIIFAYKYTEASGVPNPDDLAQGLTLAAIAGIQDTQRIETVHSVKAFKTAEVTLRLTTADRRTDAVRFAKSYGILPELYEFYSGDNIVLRGEDLRERIGLVDVDEVTHEILPMPTAGSVKRLASIEDFRKIARRLRVLAEATPLDEFILATGLKQIGGVVALVAESVSETSALSAADLGIMCNSDRETADMILADHSLNAITQTLKSGRALHDNVRKFLQYNLTVSAVTLINSFVSACVLGEFPLTAVHVLWIYLISNLLGALALSTEPPHDSLLVKSPVDLYNPLISADMMKSVVGHSVYQLVWLTVILILGPDLFHLKASWDSEDYDAEYAAHFTILFNTLVCMQVFNAINCRKLQSSELNIFTGFCTSWLFWAVLLLISIVQVLLITFGGETLRVAQLDGRQWGFCVLIGAGELVIGPFLRLLPDAVFKCCSIPAPPRESQQPSLVNLFRRRPRNPI